MTREQLNLATTNRTPNPGCPACQNSRLHYVTEWQVYHVNAGRGFDKVGEKPIAPPMPK